ncbi:MAG: glycosyltransferase family 2 protein [Planctomycetes bacterium]|nr:glycosyltransferase family 2 protein [Planctomycetota bacterium]
MSSPFITCIVLSHDKPEFVTEAIESLARQSLQDWEAIVFDSGDLYDRGFFQDLPILNDPRFRLIRSWETEELRRTKTIASWCFNECFRKELVRGRYVTYLCDDDLLYQGAFAAFHQYLKAHAGTMAMYGSVDMTVVNRYGEKYFMREIVADEVKGRCCDGGPLDCHVDYLQLCHHVDVLETFPTDEYWSEDRAVIHHADGVFLEQIGESFPIVPVDAKIGENRKVPQSLNEGGDTAELLAERCRKAEVERRLKRLGRVGRWILRKGIADWYRAQLLRWRSGKWSTNTTVNST